VKESKHMHPWYRFGFKITEYIMAGIFNAEVEGREHVPAVGGCLVVANHVSFFDPNAIGWALDREIYFLARKTLFNVPILGTMLKTVNVIPVDQQKPDMNGPRTVIKLLQQGEMVLLFPEGERSWKGDLLPGKPGAGMVACKANVPILPARVFGTYEILPRGASRPKHHPIRIVFGKPFHVPQAEAGIGKKELYQRVSQQMMDEIAKLA
jgi:1-acyl-sn-glycerol-3-phosphate acyltransferase